MVPIPSLLGGDDTPGEPADRSNPVPAPLARKIAATGHTHQAEVEPPPIGRWPTPTVRDEHTRSDGSST